MLDICLVGTGGMKPLPNRWLTSLYAKSDGHAVLIDCGEGTQIALSKSGCNLKPIDVICITHFHADHIAGLPGLLLSMGNCDRTEPITICGPEGLYDILEGLLKIARDLPFDIMVSESEESAKQTLETGPISIESFPVSHRIPCLGYCLKLSRKGKFNPQKARDLNIPIKAWRLLQNGASVKLGNKIITPSLVLGPDRRGISVVYSTDTRPVPEISKIGKDSDLMILEGLYSTPDKIDKAKKWGHMTFSEAAKLAKDANAKELWLTHYSPSLTDPQNEIANVLNIFPNTYAGFDGKKTTLKFIDE